MPHLHVQDAERLPSVRDQLRGVIRPCRFPDEISSLDRDVLIVVSESPRPFENEIVFVNFRMAVETG